MAYLMKQGSLPLADIALGRVPGFSTIDKFGRAPSGIQTTATDIWDLADATPTSQLWVPPTQARIHNLSSSSAEDGAGGATGALTVRIYGLTSWSTLEVSEVVPLNGTGNVATANEYVIIHRMKVLTAGSADGAVGIITATAQTDGTVTAAILPGPGIGQTRMAIYGVPSCCKLLIYGYVASQLRATAGQTIATNISLLVNESPNTNLDLFLGKETDALFGSGDSSEPRPYFVPKPVDGPAIVKFQAAASAADTDLSVRFDALLVEI
jgi:hypothetical protein